VRLRLLLLPLGDRLDAVARSAWRGRPTEPPPERDDTIRQGTPAANALQVFAAVTSNAAFGVTIKADVPTTPWSTAWIRSTPAPTGTSARRPRDVRHQFAGHPDLRNMYLPTRFEGPAAQGLPAVAHGEAVAGIVDVEPLPATTRKGAEGEADARADASDDLAIASS
jgi:hypothetical protein